MAAGIIIVYFFRSASVPPLIQRFNNSSMTISAQITLHVEEGKEYHVAIYDGESYRGGRGLIFVQYLGKSTEDNWDKLCCQMKNMSWYVSLVELCVLT